MNEPPVQSVAGEGTKQLLSVADLSVRIPTGRGTIRAVDRVSFSIGAGEVVGLVGESGSGKSVTCRSVMGLMRSPPVQVSGSAIWSSRDGVEQDLLELSKGERRRLWGSELSMIFQDPMTALNPVMRVGKQVAEAVASHQALGREGCEARTVELFTQVGIPSPRDRMRDYPYQFSGGMLQRVLIAIALASRPRILFADEPTTSLDVIVQDQILELLIKLQADLSMSVLLVSHDLAVVTGVCDRVLVMYAGQVVESASADELLSNPQHPYTVALLRSLPQGAQRYLLPIPGLPPDMIGEMSGCRFAPRCPLAEDSCCTWKTELLQVSASDTPHFSRCRRLDDVHQIAGSKDQSKLPK